MDTKLDIKWRPKQLTDLIGQDIIVKAFLNASRNQAYSSAYMFSGNHGCGKTSTARILANLMTCIDVKDGKVCGECRACKTIPLDVSVDVKELDAASNRGIAEAHTIIESATWSPQELNRKIFIIDECHRLTKDAISALLKILEEPPENVTFILCTTEPRNLLPTILSRCQKFNFGKIPSVKIIKHMEEMATAEEIDIDDEAISMISKMARGSMRDAISYLEQIGVIASGERITLEHIQQIFGVVDRAGAIAMVQAMIAANLPLLIDQVNDLVMASADSKQILFEIAEIFRVMMLIKVKANKRVIDLPDNEISELQKIAEPLSVAKLIKMAHVFSDVERKLDFNIHERWVMESTLISCVALLRK